MCRRCRHIFYCILSGLEPAATGAANVTATAIVAIIGGAIDAMVAEATPENDEDYGSKYGTDERHASQARLSRDREVEQTHDDENRQKSQNNSANNAIWCAPAGDQLSNEADNSS